jgi:hypothetical protein
MITMLKALLPNFTGNASWTCMLFSPYNHLMTRSLSSNLMHLRKTQVRCYLRVRKCCEGWEKILTFEELMAKTGKSSGDNNKEDNNNTDGWIDEMEELDDEDQKSIT